MAGKKRNPFGWFAHGPLGPWARRLGFRWVFPVGTMAVPFHPLVFPVALALIIAWAIRSALTPVVHAVGPGWPGMLLAAGILGVTMSVPILAWVVMALGGRLIQAVLILCAMLLVMFDVWQGRIDPLWSLLPGSYWALFLVQALLGKPFVRRLEREMAGFAPQGPGQTPVVLAGFDHGARNLIENCAIPSLYAPPLRGTVKAKHFHWLAPQDAAELSAAWGDDPPRGWKLEPRAQGNMLIRENAAAPGRAIRVEGGTYRAPAWLVTGLRKIEARGDGRHWRILYGEAATIWPVPLATLFRFTSISGPSYNKWVAGFSRRKAATLASPDEGAAPRFDRLFPPRSEADNPFDKAGLPGLHAEIAAHQRQRATDRAAALANLDHCWDALMQGAALTRLDQDSIQLMRAEPELLHAERVETTLDWLERAREARQMVDLIHAARLLQAFPEADLAPHGARLETIFASKRLALQWNIHEVPDRTSLPKDCPLFAGTYAGFGLFLCCPGLYEKLAELSPRLAKIARILERQQEQEEPGLCRNHTLVMSGRYGDALGSIGVT